jgi:hypothetical protein
MEDFTLPIVGARLKKWECCRSSLPKCQAHPLDGHNFFFKVWKKLEKIKQYHSLSAGIDCRLWATSEHQPAAHPRLLVGQCAATNGCRPLPCGAYFSPLCKIPLLPLACIFGHMWSILAGWL